MSEVLNSIFRSFTLSNILSISAFIVSIIAVFVAIKQFKLSRKQSVLPLLYIENTDLKSGGNCPEENVVVYEKYARCEANGTLDERTVAQGAAAIDILLSNVGIGLAKNIYIFNKNNGDLIKYYIPNSKDSWFKKKQINLAPNKNGNNILVGQKYIREKELKDGEEECSDFTNLLFYYSDIFNNYYTMEVKIEIRYIKEDEKFIIEYDVTKVEEANKKNDRKKYKNSDLYKIIYSKR